MGRACRQRWGKRKKKKGLYKVRRGGLESTGDRGEVMGYSLDKRGMGSGARGGLQFIHKKKDKPILKNIKNSSGNNLQLLGQHAGMLHVNGSALQFVHVKDNCAGAE